MNPAVAVRMAFMAFVALGACAWGADAQVEGVAARSAINVDTPSGINQGRLRQFVDDLLAPKIQQARRELAAFKIEREDEKKKAEEAAREAARRRSAVLGIQASGQVETAAPSLTYRATVNLSIPELAQYRQAAVALRNQSAVCWASSEFLTGLDKDGDDKLTGEEYKRAVALHRTVARVLQPLDRNGDGQITSAEAESMLEVPRNLKAAIEKAMETGRLEGFKIPGFDENQDGELDLYERKAFAMGLISASIRADADRDFYRSVIDAIRAAQDRAIEGFQRQFER